MSIRSAKKATNFMWQQYHSVSSIAEALELLDKYQGRARIIAGGTDILLEMEQGKRPNVDVLIDITRIPDLDAIRLHGETIVMGALVNHNHVVASDLIRQRALPLAQASWEVGAPQIRNRATVAGNLITASSANDTISPLMALGAEVTLASVEGERTVALKDFYTGLRRTVMRPNEMLTSISFPAMSKQERGMFLKLGLRRAQAIAVINATVILSFDADETIRQAVITLGSVAPTIIRTPTAEQALIGKKLTPELIAQAARLAGAAPTPIDDVRSTAEYRSEMAKVLVARALRTLAAHEENKLPENPAMLWGETEARVYGNGLQEGLLHEDGSLIEVTINGIPRKIYGGQPKSLLHWLREDAGLVGTKEGCAEGECGACTIFLDGVAVMACMVAAPRAHGTSITTVEGLKEDERLHPIQAAFVDEGAVQCGFCTPGFLMSGAKLLEEAPQASLEQIQQSISGNLCRCTGYTKIIAALKQASAQVED
jgi:xanthine dehydrogenase iron-sulfur cluster and FAD-binding subunit A